jgi:hypothetical protein
MEKSTKEMKLSTLIKQGYLEDTKEGYIVRKNFSLNDLMVDDILDKSLIIPEGAVVDLTGGYYDMLEEWTYHGQGPFIKSGKKEATQK